MSETPSLKIVSLDEAATPELLSFSDRVLGANYFKADDFDEFKKSSQTGAGSVSMALVDDAGKVYGVRLTHPPGGWQKGKGKGLSPERWGFSLDEVAYFQSLFVDPSLTGQGFGPKMSQASIAKLRKIGAKAVICHSWVESPNNSSFRYLKKLGFESITVHKLYWRDVDYVCTRCGSPCLCSAEEMILKL